MLTELRQGQAGPDDQPMLRIAAELLQIPHLPQADKLPGGKLPPFHVGVEIGAASDQHGVGRILVGQQAHRLAEGFRSQVGERR